MTIESYLNLYELLEKDNSTRETNRAFGLSHILLKDKPTEQLIEWVQEHKVKLSQPSMADAFSGYLYAVTLTLTMISFVLGLLSGLGLLSYSGHEPVNVIYFIAIAVFFPLLTMMLTVISMFRIRNTQSLLVHISPAFWMEKILVLLPYKVQENIQNFKINPLLANWMLIKRSQLIALSFSSGLFMALLTIVVTKDIAFAWSTTLHITPETFHEFLNTLAFAWRDTIPSAVPSIELITQSQYFRLGDRLSEGMIANASKLGEWWKFLAFATLFYAIFLRLLMLLFTKFSLDKAVKKSLQTLRGASKILEQMNEAVISTHALQDEETFVTTKENYGQIIHKLDASYDAIHGWAINKEQLLVLNDSMRVISPNSYEVGGANSFDEDNEIISKSKGEVLFFVKGWEPPTMDFVDYLVGLSEKVDKIVVVPVGMDADNYKIKHKFVDIWDRKLTQINEDKVWLKR